MRIIENREYCVTGILNFKGHFPVPDGQTDCYDTLLYSSWPIQGGNNIPPLTGYGPSAPIKDMMRPDYEEPDEPPNNVLEVENKFGYTLSERVKELDCYIGFTDGYAYRSWDRLTRMRRKYVLKPVGPTDMYKYPGVKSMDYGWWNSDPDLKTDWYKPRVLHSQTTSEMSRFHNHCLKVDKYFKN